MMPSVSKLIRLITGLFTIRSLLRSPVCGVLDRALLHRVWKRMQQIFKFVVCWEHCSHLQCSGNFHKNRSFHRDENFRVPLSARLELISRTVSALGVFNKSGIN